MRPRGRAGRRRQARAQAGVNFIQALMQCTRANPLDVALFGQSGDRGCPRCETTDGGEPVEVHALVEVSGP